MSDDEFLGEFITESREHLESAESALLAMLHHPDRERLHACFRSLHTVKGGAGFLHLSEVQALAHIAEQLLEDLSTERLAVTTERIDGLLAAVSQLGQMVTSLEHNGTSGLADKALIERLEALSGKRPRSSTNISSSEFRKEHGADPAAVEAISKRMAQLHNDDIPGLIEAIQAMKDLAKEQEWNEDACLIVARISAVCDDMLFLPKEEIAQGFARIRSLLQDLPQQPSTTQREKRAVVTKAIANARRDTTSAQRQSQHLNEGTLADFLTEYHEILEDMEETLLTAGDQALSPAQIGDLFRHIHTIKGMSGYIGFGRLEKLAHLVEGHLMPVRDGKAPYTKHMARILLDSVDVFRVLGAQIQQRKKETGTWPTRAVALAKELSWAGDLPKTDHHSPVSEALEPNQVLVPRVGDLLQEQGVSRDLIEETAKHKASDQPLGEALIAAGVASAEQVSEALHQQSQAKVLASKKDTSTRVSITRLDDLVNLVGELLIAQSMVNQEASQVQATRLVQSVGRMSRIVRDLQALSLSLRMVPLKSTFQKMSRAVHDTAAKVGKQVQLVLDGEDTEIDRTLAEMIADPLLHMVRNAVDHGIEDSAKRVARGKNPQGSIVLAAQQTSDHVVITLEDDGGGIDPDKVKRKAIEKQLIPADSQLSIHEAYKLIMLPGFSTAEKVTGISGRGVGMDVAQKNIHALGGTIEIDSSLGKGTLFTIRLPLTTAILDAMLLKVGEARFLLPITSIVEAVKPEATAIQQVMGKGKVVKSRGHLLPLLRLKDVFALDEGRDRAEDSTILTIEYFGGSYALQVDELLGQQQVVIKPLGSQFAYHPGLAGSAILGDGLVALIIDPAHVIQASADQLSEV